MREEFERHYSSDSQRQQTAPYNNRQTQTPNPPNQVPIAMIKNIDQGTGAPAKTDTVDVDINGTIV
jgi:hypothetical protein